MLSGLGYRDTACTGSVEALDLFRVDAAAFDIVITDMTMPDMTGTALAEAMLKIRPGIPIILLTGYSKHLSAERIDDIGIQSLIYKPVVQKELAMAVRAVLAQDRRLPPPEGSDNS